jgi:hypothetical protein
VSHFSNLFASSTPPIEDDMLSLFAHVVFAKDNLFLCALPPEEEVVQALSTLGSTKDPGLDGYTALFYKKFWPIVKLMFLTVLVTSSKIIICLRS